MGDTSDPGLGGFSTDAAGYTGAGPFQPGSVTAGTGNAIGGGVSAAGGAASGLSLASVGLQAYGAITSAQGTAAGDTFKAEELDQQAQYGDLKAVQTGAQMTRNLATTLGNIDATRAAAHDDPTSPTGAAVRDYAEQIGTEQKTTKVDSILAQSGMDEANAAYMRQASSEALLSGDISAGSDVLKGIAGALPALALA